MCDVHEQTESPRQRAHLIECKQASFQARQLIIIYRKNEIIYIASLCKIFDLLIQCKIMEFNCYSSVILTSSVLPPLGTARHQAEAPGQRLLLHHHHR